MSESIGSIYETKIPGLEEAADIQAALKLYHYGSDVVPTTTAGIEPNSIAGHLQDLRNDVTSLETTGVGSEYSSTKPTSPADGFIWVDSTASLGAVTGAIVAYQNDAPTTGLVDGQLWVDKNSSPLKMYVYDLGSTSWKEIGA